LPESVRADGNDFDLARFNVGDTHSLIVGVRGNNEFSALETVRASVAGSDHMETRVARFDPIPPKTTVLVQMADADGKSLLYEGEFAIVTNPLRSFRCRDRQVRLTACCERICA